MTFSRADNQTDAGTSPRAALAWAAVVAAVVAATFALVPTFGFVTWDDDIHVYSNPNLNPLTAQSLAHLWTAPYEKLYIPLSYSFFALLSLFARGHGIASDAGFDPHVFHSASLVLQIADTLIVFAILRALVKRDFAVALGALVYGIHPLQVESVAWISELRGLLANLFGLAAIWSYVAVDKPTVRRVWLTSAPLVVLALLCKPTAVVVPLAMFAIAVGMKARPLRSAALETLPLMALAVPIMAVTHAVQPTFTDPVPWLQRPLVAMDALAFYLGKLFWPVALNADYGRTPHAVLASGWGHITWLAPLAAAGIAGALRRRAPAIATGLAVFAIVFLPVLGLLPFAYQQYSTVADRYASLALLGPALAVAALAASWRPPAVAVGFVVTTLLAVASFAQTRVWANSVALYDHCVALNPQSPGCNNNLGVLLLEQGKAQDATKHFLAAIQSKGDFPGIYSNLGDAYTATGSYSDAQACYAYATVTEPGNAENYYKLGNALLSLRQLDDAIAAYSKAQKLAPEHAEVYRGLGKAFAAKGDYRNAEAAYRIALKRAPTDAATQAALADAIKRQGK
jgi:tetratricopeptide (TPR) repeat protein